MSITLRPYQDAMLGDVRDAFRSGFKTPLLTAPTGSGKTVLFSFVASKAAGKGNKVLILVHRQELIRQTSATLTAFDVPHGIIASGVPETDEAVQVASVQTLVRRLDRMTWTPTLIVVDEAHHATRTTGHGRVLAHYPEARVLGVTATPERLDGQGLGALAGGFFDALVMGPTVAELVQLGHLSKPVVYAPPSAVDLSGIRTVAGDFNKGDLAAAMNRPAITGDAVQHYARHCNSAPAIGFCCSVAHAESVAEAFKAAGYQAASIDGTLDPDTRAQRIADLGSGALQVLTSCEIISEGTDIPIVAAAILLRPTQSLALYLQQVGRCLRPFPGKDRAVILDHVGNCHRHGLPDDDREWSLDSKPRRQRKKEDDETPTRQCEHCYEVHRPAPECPSCGFIYPVKSRRIEQVDGDLQEIAPDPARLAAKREQAKAATLDDLRKIAAARGYSPRWAEHVYRARQAKQTAWRGAR
ncbi:MAG: DEAD/DEAH box helicase [Alphaproteobacteria bacterium]|jgi:superfamily II DNA or RNA helicase|nr:DEAD/DEAH box helicase [Alphaproteobacteria bacterium]